MRFSNRHSSIGFRGCVVIFVGEKIANVGYEVYRLLLLTGYTFVIQEKSLLVSLRLSNQRLCIRCYITGALAVLFLSCRSVQGNLTSSCFLAPREKAFYLCCKIWLYSLVCPSVPPLYRFPPDVYFVF